MIISILYIFAVGAYCMGSLLTYHIFCAACAEEGEPLKGRSDILALALSEFWPITLVMCGVMLLFGREK